MTWILDLDGVVWRGAEAIPGAAQAVARLRGRGERVVLVTNNSAMTVAEYQSKLDFFAVPTERDADLHGCAENRAGRSGRPAGCHALARRSAARHYWQRRPW